MTASTIALGTALAILAAMLMAGGSPSPKREATPSRRRKAP